MRSGDRPSDAEEDAEQEGDEGAREVVATQGRDRVGETVREREERSERILRGAEGTLEGGFLGRRAFLLRLVIHAEALAGLARRLGEVRRALVDEELGARQARERLRDGAHDEVGVLLRADGEGGEEILLSPARVLGGDEAQVDAEGADVRRVGEGLQVRRAQLEREAALATWRRDRRPRRGVGRVWGNGRVATPRAEGSLGDPECATEATPPDVELGAESLGGGDEAGLQSAIADTALGDHGGGDGELGLGDGEACAQVLDLAVGGAAAATVGAGDEVLDREEHAGLEARERLGGRVAIGAQRGDGTGEPPAVEGGDDRGAHEGDETGWLRREGLGRWRGHGTSSVLATRHRHATAAGAVPLFSLQDGAEPDAAAEQ